MILLTLKIIENNVDLKCEIEVMVAFHRNEKQPSKRFRHNPKLLVSSDILQPVGVNIEELLGLLDYFCSKRPAYYRHSVVNRGSELLLKYHFKLTQNYIKLL